MQSGITASQELHDAFNTLVSSFPSQRGLIATIKNEQIIPTETIQSSSEDFFDDLKALEPLIKDNEAAYIILRRYQNAPDGFVAVTYVPDHASVRSKTLFAATRLTLVRGLGTERFRETISATTKQELTADGWRKHDTSGKLKAPLTEEEQSLQNVKEAEAEASRGTTSRSSMVTAGRISFPISEDALQALKDLPSGANNFVQLKFEIAKEALELVEASSTDAEGLATIISDTAPRFTFFRHSYESEGQKHSPVIFIYTCPPGSKIKERMVYASARNSVVFMAGNQAGLDIAKKLEASSPSEITAATIREEFDTKPEQKQAFSRPKRPGQR